MNTGRCSTVSAPKTYGPLGRMAMARLQYSNGQVSCAVRAKNGGRWVAVGWGAFVGAFRWQPVPSSRLSVQLARGKNHAELRKKIDKKAKKSPSKAVEQATILSKGEASSADGGCVVKIEACKS